MTAQLRRLYRYRGMIKHMYVRDLKIRYERSIFGFAWTLLNPAAMLVVYTIFFSVVIRLNIPRFPIYLLSGLLAWNFVNRGMTSVSSTIWYNSYLINRVSFPHEALVISGMLSLLTDFLFELVVLIGVMAVLGVPMSIALVFVPISAAILFMFGLGVALFFAVWVALYRDTEYLLSIVSTAWFYMTPIFYSMKMIPQKYLAIYKLNPMVHMLSLFREPIYSGNLPPLHTLGIALMCSTLMLAVGMILFKKYSPLFAELI